MNAAQSTEPKHKTRKDFIRRVQDILNDMGGGTTVVAQDNETAKLKVRSSGTELTLEYTHYPCQMPRLYIEDGRALTDLSHTNLRKRLRAKLKAMTVRQQIASAEVAATKARQHQKAEMVKTLNVQLALEDYGKFTNKPTDQGRWTNAFGHLELRSVDAVLDRAVGHYDYTYIFDYEFTSSLTKYRNTFKGTFTTTDFHHILRITRCLYLTVNPNN